MNRSPRRFTRPRFASSLIAAGFLALLVFPGCTTGTTKLDDVEKARLIKENRKEAKDVLEKFKGSGEQNIDLLNEYSELHHKNTEIAPSTCPKCWAEFAESLSMLGWKYWYDYQALLDKVEKLKSAKSPEARELKKAAAAVRVKWEDYFTRSNQAYETHFRSGDVQLIHPYSYERVMRHWELLGNYDRALFYLEKTVEGYPLLRGGLDDPTRQKFDKLRRIYRQEIQRQKEGEVTGEKEVPLRNPTGRRAPPAKKTSAPEPEPEEEE